jgi:hypothetical protein
LKQFLGGNDDLSRYLSVVPEFYTIEELWEEYNKEVDRNPVEIRIFWNSD